jgi:hypothetical protein
VNGDVGEDFAVHRVAGRFQSADELGVGHPVQPRRGVDAGDPERAEITLAILAAGKRRVQRLVDGLLRNAVPARLHPVEALGELQDFHAAILSLRTSFDSCHVLLVSFLFERPGQE